VTELTVLSWNLFHGRDAPPNPAIQRRALHLQKGPLDDGAYLQLNRSLEDEFAGLIAAARWSVCVLQEAPPGWAEDLGRRCGAQVVCTLTSRNQFAPLTRLISRWRPDLLGSWEGGSNMTLVRPPWEVVAGSERSIVLNPLRERRLAERRRLTFVRVRETAGGGIVCVGNMHLSGGARAQAERELRRAAKATVAWAQGDPLVFAGDFNLRPKSSPDPFAQLARDFGLVGVTSADAIDHILARGLDRVGPTAHWEAARRELEVPRNGETRRIRLSDHAPVAVTFGTSRMR
jgi:endonuclease/exonuclease/phosphatase family metal-dependent hydrolase